MKRFEFYGIIVIMLLFSWFLFQMGRQYEMLDDLEGDISYILKTASEKDTTQLSGRVKPMLIKAYERGYLDGQLNVLENATSSISEGQWKVDSMNFAKRLNRGKADISH